MESNELMTLLSAAQDEPVVAASIGSSENNLQIDWGTRKITIPSTVTNAGVRLDHLSKKLVIEMDREVNGQDLTAHTFAIHFMNVKKWNGPDHEYDELASGVYAVTSIDTSVEGKVIVEWDITNASTQIAGVIGFALHVYTILDGSFTYHLGTVPAILNLQDTVSATEHGENVTPAELEVWLQKLQEVAAQIDEMAATAVQDYLKANPISGNVQADMSMNDETNPAYVKNRTHSATITQEAETVTVEFDGDLTDREYVEVIESSSGDVFQYFVKLSDRYVEPSAFSESIVVSDGTEDATVAVSDLAFLSFSEMNSGSIVGNGYSCESIGFIAVQDTFTAGGDNDIQYTLTAGLWTVYGTSSIPYIKSLTYNIPLVEEVSQLDPKFVPNIADMAVNDESSQGFIKNRTHYTEIDAGGELIWNGSMMGHVSARCYKDGVETTFDSDGISNFYHISDIPLSIDALEKSTVTATAKSSDGSITDKTIVLADKWDDLYEEFMIMMVYSEGTCFFSTDAGIAVALVDNATITITSTTNDVETVSSVVFPKIGTYAFLDYGSPRKYISKITTPWIGKKLDHNYVPNSDWSQGDEDGEGYIKNRTHYAVPSFKISWDCDTENRDFVHFFTVEETQDTNGRSVYYYHVSDKTLTEEEYKNSTCNVETRAGGMTMDQNSVQIADVLAEDPEAIYVTDNGIFGVEGSVIISYVDNWTINPTDFGLTDESFQSFTLPKKGTYFIYMTFTENGINIGYTTTSIIGPEVVKYLDEKYIPDSIARVGSSEVVLEKTTFTSALQDEESGTYGITNPFTFSIAKGELYAVTWDGTEYICQATRTYPTEDVTVIYLGSLDASDSEPFAVSVTSESSGITYSVVCHTDTEPMSHTISIRRIIVAKTVYTTDEVNSLIAEIKKNVYSRAEIDNLLGTNLEEVASLVGGDA